VRELVLHRGGACVDGVRVRSHGRRFPCRIDRDLDPGRHASARIALSEPAERTAPGQLACLYAGDVVVGYGTIDA
jgi:tRNA U34 2-thiouridine synthase MnmA/TrmU